MSTTFTPSQAKQAIERSVSHNEIVRIIAVNGMDAAYSQVSAVADECDYSEEDNGDWDVYGTDDSGSDFRIRLTRDGAW